MNVQVPAIQQVPDNQRCVQSAILICFTYNHMSLLTTICCYTAILKQGVVFMTFWQGLMINIFFHFSKYTNNSSSSNDDSTISANGIQHILICMEMLFFSIAHWCVFPAEEWQDGYKVQYYEGPGFGFKDFASDVSLIIDDGKKSIRARRERKKSNGSGLDEKDGSVSTSGLSLNGRESPSFGSVDETPDLDSNSSTQPFV